VIVLTREVVCGVCQKPIGDGEPFIPLGALTTEQVPSHAAGRPPTDKRVLTLFTGIHFGACVAALFVPEAMATLVEPQPLKR
jgi:hypothetical protein